MTAVFAPVSSAAVLAASFAAMMLGWLWFAVLFERPYAIVLGRSNEPKSKMAPLYFVGPSLCMLVTAAASAVLMKAAGVESLEEALGFGALVGIGLLLATAMNMAIRRRTAGCRLKACGRSTPRRQMAGGMQRTRRPAPSRRQPSLPMRLL